MHGMDRAVRFHFHSLIFFIQNNQNCITLSPLEVLEIIHADCWSLNVSGFNTGLTEQADDCWLGRFFRPVSMVSAM